ncbi:putative branched-subunit amino acid permease [Actinomycetospora succinea]|uniref:Putative branched-subunit amino acid permease n=1 Tax=Actinomycetospora succinea TaxID=663603 RepID=A0A4R6VHF1_9PSEU|nr:AzlC family ABC transporter permease [Actinomycetospora succinea]TDQ62758.1 putative branched-subunit amino acid permease [Actinomycetospora succinea]
MSITERHTFRGGEVRTAVRDLAPVALGLVPFALLIGVTGARSAAGGGTAVLSSVLLLGGSAQMTALTLLAGGAASGAVIATVAVVNARFLLYSAALEPHFRDQPTWFRWLAPHFVVDPTYAMVSRRLDALADPAAFRRYWLVGGGGLALAWIAMTAAGALLAPVLPASAALTVAAPAMFLAMLVPQLKQRTGRRAAAVAGVVAAVAATLPHGLGLLAAIVTGVLVTTLTDRSAS